MTSQNARPFESGCILYRAVKLNQGISPKGIVTKSAVDGPKCSCARSDFLADLEDAVVQTQNPAKNGLLKVSHDRFPFDYSREGGDPPREFVWVLEDEPTEGVCHCELHLLERNSRILAEKPHRAIELARAELAKLFTLERMPVEADEYLRGKPELRERFEKAC